MVGMDLGPKWIWKAGCLFAAIGVVSAIYFIVIGIIWVFDHVKIVL